MKNLQTRDKCRTFEIIKQELKDIGYNLYYSLLNAGEYGIAQTRKRIYLVCIRKDLDNHDFKIPQENHKLASLKDILMEDEKCLDFVINKACIPDKHESKNMKISVY